MTLTPTAAVVDRPQRWDSAFDPDMSEAHLERLLATPPFATMNASAFPRRLPLREILRNDTRILCHREGEIIVRVGDYGSSAFMVLSGRVRVALAPGLPRAVLGRLEPRRKNIFRWAAQAWSFLKPPESSHGSGGSHAPREFSAAAGAGPDTRVVLQDVPRVLDMHQTATLEAGEFFGEIAALSRRPRTATAFAETEGAELLEIRWQGLRDLMRYDRQLQVHIDDIYRARALKTFLQALPLFRHLQEPELQEVMKATRFATFGEYDWSGSYKRLARGASGWKPDQEPVIAEEDAYPNGVLFIRSGFARLSQRYGNGERTLNYLGAGQSYGLAELAHNARRPKDPVSLQFTLRAIGYTHVLAVPTAVMERVVLPGVPARLVPELSTERWDLGPTGHAAARVGLELFEFMAEHRFFNGTATMVIDLDRCTRCDDCVRACAATHENNPRFLRHGPILGPVMVANACMHCVDPVCMIGCPTGAIQRSTFQGQVVINAATCIGCQACFQNCPYDAIRMVEARDPRGRILVDSEMKPIQKATKCDLCFDQFGGPACQRACPHDALARLNLTDLGALEQWLHR